MADVEGTVDCILQLNITELDEEWVKQAHQNEYVDLEPLSVAIQEQLSEKNYYRRELREMQAMLQPWVKGHKADTGEGLWAVLVENNIPVKNLLALLCYIMDSGQQRLANGIRQEACIQASVVCLTLSATPGSVAFKAFHPMLIQKAVDSFKLWKNLDVRPKEKAAAASSQKGGKKQPVPESTEEESLFDDEVEDAALTPEEVMTLNRALFHFLRLFVSTVHSFSLKQHEQLTLHSIAQLADLSKLEAETVSSKLDLGREVSQIKTVPELAYKGLQCLCLPIHGDPASLILSVFKHLLNSLLMLVGDARKNALQTIPRYVQSIKDQALDFVCCLVQGHGPVASMPLRTLVQNMASKVPDRAEYRKLVSQSIVKLMREMPTPRYAEMLKWIHNYMRTGGMSYRVFALELIALLLAEDERQDATLSEENQMFLSKDFLVRVMISRSSDAAPTVRAKAMQNFAQLCSSSNSRCLIKEIVTPSVTSARSRLLRTPGPGRPVPILSLNAGNESNESTKVGSQTEPAMKTIAASGSEMHSPGSSTMQTTNDTNKPSHSSTDVTPSSEKTGSTLLPEASHHLMEMTLGVTISMVEGRSIVSTLRRRAGDGKVNVRKAALQALENIIRLDEESFRTEDLEVLAERCRDPALSVRRQSMTSLTALLVQMPMEDRIQKAWLGGVLPMVIDRETSVQEKCLQIVEELFLLNLAPYHRSSDQGHVMLWKILQIIADPPSEEARKYLQKACQLWSKAKVVKPANITNLQTHVGTEHNQAAWMWLLFLVPVAPKFKPDFVLDYWHSYASKASDPEYRTVEWVLTVLGHVSQYFNERVLSEVAGDLKERLMKFDSPPELISAMVGTLNKVCQKLVDNPSQRLKVTEEWFGQLLKACDRYLSAAILNEDPEKSLNETECIRHLFTLGEITQLCPAKTPKRVFMLVQSIIAAPVITSHDIPASQQPPSTQDPSQLPATDPEDAASQPSAQTQVLSQFRGSKMSSRIRAHAFIALGKLCLQNEDLAKKCVPAMARELEMSQDIAVRSNVVIILSDLCIRYTTLVDRYVGNVSACLKDEAPLIRMQTLTLLTQLVQEDFLKWKGTLFYRVLSTLVDDSKDVRNFAHFWLLHLLLRRHPSIFFHHFVECIFYFNSFNQHKVFNNYSESDRERKLFTMKGKAHARKRMKLYSFLLQHMTDEHKFHLTAKLCKEILGAAVDDLIPLDGNGTALLQDTMSILASKEIKLASMRAVTHDDPEDEVERAEVVMSAAKKTIITQVFKRNVIENVVPTVVSLKHKLESCHSSALKELMLFLRELMKDYKNEVKDILSADRQLASEIEFDMRKFEEEEQRNAERLRQRVQARGSGIGTTGRSPTGSPQPVAGSHQGLSPQTQGQGVRHPLSTPPRRPGMPGVCQLTAQKNVRMATPLATIALLNSARRAAIMQARKANDAQTSPSCHRKSDQSANWASAEVTERSRVSSDSHIVQTPGKSNASRAISTPHNCLTQGNITFGPDQSMNPPPSPIPSSASHGSFMSNRKQATAPATPSWTVEQAAGDGKQSQKMDVIHMLSPDKPPPRVRQWNLKVPAASGSHSQAKSTNDQQPEVGDAMSREHAVDTRKRLRSNSLQAQSDAPPPRSLRRNTRSKQQAKTKSQSRGPGRSGGQKKSEPSAENKTSRTGLRRQSLRRK